MQKLEQLKNDYDQFLKLITKPSFTPEQEQLLNKNLKQLNFDMKKKIKQKVFKLIGQFKTIEQLQKITYNKIDKKILQICSQNQYNIKNSFLIQQLKNLGPNTIQQLLQSDNRRCKIIVNNLIVSHSKQTFFQQLIQQLKGQKICVMSSMKFKLILQNIFVKFQKINIIRNFGIKYCVETDDLFEQIQKCDPNGFRQKMDYQQKKQRRNDILQFIKKIFPKQQSQIKFFSPINFLDQLTYGRKKTIQSSQSQQSEGIEDYIVVKDHLQFDSVWKYLMAIELHQNENISQQKLTIYKKQNPEIPFEAIGNIKSYKGENEIYSIGFLISKNIVLTCAHAIIDKATGQQYKKIIFMLKDKQYVPIRRYYPSQYIQSYEKGILQHIAQKERILNDFALIQLGNDVDLSGTHGYFGLFGKDLSLLTTKQIELLGFMKEKENQSKQQREQRLKKNELKHAQSKFLKSSYGNVVGYNADTLHGFSGSPGFITYQDNPFVISIHTNRIDPSNFTKQKFPKKLQSFISRQQIQYEKKKKEYEDKKQYVNNLIESYKKFFVQIVQKNPTINERDIGDYKKLQSYISNQNIQLSKIKQNFEGKQKNIQNLMKKTKSFQKYRSLSNPIILGTYIGQQIKQYLNQWINTQKVDLTLQTSNNVKRLINIISTRNSDEEQHRIKHLILNYKDLKTNDIVRIIFNCKSLFYLTNLELQGNDLMEQFQSLIELKQFKNLEYLNLNDTGITNKEIQLLKSLKYLGKLSIARNSDYMPNKINDQTLELFYDGFKLLKYLDMSGYKLSIDKIKQLKQKRPSLLIKY